VLTCEKRCESGEECSSFGQPYDASDVVVALAGQSTECEEFISMGMY